jgi:hypothetical protein
MRVVPLDIRAVAVPADSLVRLSILPLVGVVDCQC